MLAMYRRAVQCVAGLSKGVEMIQGEQHEVRKGDKFEVRRSLSAPFAGYNSTVSRVIQEL